jgi:hypothetical protein
MTLDIPIVVAGALRCATAGLENTPAKTGAAAGVKTILIDRARMVFILVITRLVVRVPKMFPLILKASR